MVLVLKRQQPFLLFFLVLTTLSGFGVVANDPEPSALPNHVTIGWAWCLLITGSLGLIGVGWQRWRVMRGMLIVRGSLMMQAGAVIVYAGFLIGYQVEQWLLSVIAAAVWVWACLAEARLLRKDLGLIEEATSHER